MTDVQKRIAELNPEQRRLLELRLKRKNLAPPPSRGIERRPGPGPHPLSANQRWLWKIDQLSGGNPAWNVYTGMTFNGVLDVAVLGRSLNELVRRHEVLRSAFPLIDGRPVLAVLPEQDLPLPLIDLSALPEPMREPEARAALAERWRQLFDLSRGPLVRFTLARLAPKEHQLLVMMHHSVTDWISLAFIDNEVASTYVTLARGHKPAASPLPLHYADYAWWEEEWLKGETAREHLEYWKQKLADVPPLELPTDRPRTAVQTHWGSRPHLWVPESTYRGLKDLARAEESSLFYVLVAALNALFHGLTGQEDFSLGSPVAGRNRREVEGMIGLFLNYLAIRTDLSGDPTFRELLRRVKATILEGYAHQDLPFGTILEELMPEWDPSRHPIFQVVFFFLENPPAADIQDLGIRLLIAYGGTARFDLLVSIWDHGTRLEGWIEHNTHLYDGKTVEGWIERLCLLLADVARDPDRRLSELAQ